MNSPRPSDSSALRSTRRSSRARHFVIATVVLTAMTACGGDDDTADDDTAISEVDQAESAVATAAPTDAGDAGDSAEPDRSGPGCTSVLPAAAVESAFGMTVEEVQGDDRACNYRFENGEFASVTIFEPADADEVLGQFAAQMEAADMAESMIPVGDDDGFHAGTSAVVRGESGRAFLFNGPIDVDGSWPDAAASVAAVLQTR